MHYMLHAITNYCALHAITDKLLISDDDIITLGKKKLALALCVGIFIQNLIYPLSFMLNEIVGECCIKRVPLYLPTESLIS